MTDATITVEYIVMQAKREVERRSVVIADGVVVSANHGEPATAPDVVFTVTPALAEQLRAGDLDVSVGFMRGEIKMSGDNAALFAAVGDASAVNRAAPESQ